MGLPNSLVANPYLTGTGANRATSGMRSGTLDSRVSAGDAARQKTKAKIHHGEHRAHGEELGKKTEAEAAVDWRVDVWAGRKSSQNGGRCT